VLRKHAAAAGLSALAAVAVIAIVSCLGATQVELHVTTNLPCTDRSQWKGVAVYVGSPNDVETKAPTLTTTTCGANGQIGSLVIVPTGSESDEIGIRVVAGVTRDPEECAANQYAGCVVARRSLHYSPHKSLDAYVALTDDCVSIPCDPSHTCIGSTCTDTQAVDGTPAPADGGTSQRTVRCGDNGARCPTTGQVCCLSVNFDAGTTSGQCMDPASCPPTSIVLNCDKESDCAGPRDDAGRPNVCCLAHTEGQTGGGQPTSISGSQCLAYERCTNKIYGLELCSDRQPCVDRTVQCSAGATVPPGLLPGSFWCLIPGQ
jgi:hypothetical protein